ncbi:MAG: hypothetical protein QME81_19825 [bacterium]|nr:hypothetical protein [bacterium]
MGLTIKKQMAISSEVEELFPIFSQMKKNENIYPIYADLSPRAIDKNFFYQFHAHGHFYYHNIVGGGATPTLFHSKMNPIKFKKNASLPSIVSQPQAYKYLLVRGQLPRKYGFFNSYRLISYSGLWQLYSR